MDDMRRVLQLSSPSNGSGEPATSPATVTISRTSTVATPGKPSVPLTPAPVIHAVGAQPAKPAFAAESIKAVVIAASPVKPVVAAESVQTPTTTDPLAEDDATTLTHKQQVVDYQNRMEGLSWLIQFAAMVSSILGYFEATTEVSVAGFGEGVALNVVDINMDISRSGAAQVVGGGLRDAQPVNCCTFIPHFLADLANVISCTIVVAETDFELRNNPELSKDFPDRDFRVSQCAQIPIRSLVWRIAITNTVVDGLDVHRPNMWLLRHHYALREDLQVRRIRQYHG